MTIQKSQTIPYLLEGTSILILAGLLAALMGLHLTRPPTQYAAQNPALENTLQAKVLNVIESHVQPDDSGFMQSYQRLEVEIMTAGSYQGQRVTLNYNALGNAQRDVMFKAGERAMLMVNSRPGETPGRETDANNTPIFIITDHVRLSPLLALTAMLAIVTIIIGRWQGVRALVGLGLSVALLGGFIIPQIFAGRDPLLVSIIGIGTMLAVTTFLIQGWNPPAHTALLGILASLLITALLAVLWTGLAHLSGFGSEETLYLHAMGVRLNMRGLLLASIIIGAGGVLDDVVLAQSVTAFELAATAPNLGFRDLYHRAMKVGNAHLLTMINTLVLAYASAALPLLLLFVLYPEPAYMTLNRELIAQEVVHTLVGSLGVMLAVPLTTTIAAWVAEKIN